MNRREHLAIIGSGASSLYLLKHLLDAVHSLRGFPSAISIFEKNRITGMGMPYSPQTTDRFNMSNISSEELPELLISFADWLRAQDSGVLAALHLENVPISDSEVYSRLALGRYLNAQYKGIIARLAEEGIAIHERPCCEITDVRDRPAEGGVTLVTEHGDSLEFDRVIIATGHCWGAEDRPGEGYYASPWPIVKLLPKEGEHHNFAIGTLGASLSAFDVISSLAHRHGDFVPRGEGLTYQPHPGTEDFKIVMHAAHGLLPHLQFDQEEPRREIYRHVDRGEMLGLIDEDGFLRIGTFYDKVCRPALRAAFVKDGISEMAALLDDPGFTLRDFVGKMTARHDYANAFEGMRFEMVEAEDSVKRHKPIHWKEVIDDLMYTLNFHAERMAAEDHLLLQSVVMPFLLNVVAAMPLNSGRSLLALYDAGRLDLVSGKVTVAEEAAEEAGLTVVNVESDSGRSTHTYRMFVDCSGQKPLQLEDYPFPGLVLDRTARKARAAFASPEKAADSLPDGKKEHLFRADGRLVYHVGGIDIDGAYRLIGDDGEPNPRIHDIAFPHTTGVRPYSYGLQACNHTAAILVRCWTEEIAGAASLEKDLPEITAIYERLES